MAKTFKLSGGENGKKFMVKKFEFGHEESLQFLLAENAASLQISGNLPKFL